MASELAIIYRTIPQPCPICGSDAKVEIDDPQEPEALWRYSCGCGNMGCENYVLTRKSYESRGDAIGDWNGHVLLCSSIDYKQTPKFNDNVCHTLTHEGDGGIHSAVAYAEPLVMASGQANAEICEGGGGAHPDAAPRGARTSGGADVFPSLCATDGDKQFIDNQSVDGGRLVLDPRREWP